MEKQKIDNVKEYYKNNMYNMTNGRTVQFVQKCAKVQAQSLNYWGSSCSVSTNSVRRDLTVQV